jgi:hypothetical protein
MTFDEESLVADAGPVLEATLVTRLGFEAVLDAKARLVDGLPAPARTARSLT